MPRAPELRKNTIRVAAGILLDERGQLLLTDRLRAASMRDFWEFPGGKLRDGEGAENALRRELGEELGIEIENCAPFHRLAHAYAEYCVEIEFFLVTAWSGVPRGMEGQTLRWLTAAELSPEILLPADVPVIPLLNKMWERH